MFALAGSADSVLHVLHARQARRFHHAPLAVCPLRLDRAESGAVRRQTALL